MKGRDNDVAKDKFDVLGPAYAEIGVELAEIVGGDADGAFIYAEAGDGWYDYSVYKDEGATVRYHRASPELGDLIYEAWLLEEPSKRWAVMEYQVNGTKFDAQFRYPEEVDVESFEEDRREIALRKRYGDKPVIYPPLPSHFEEFK